MLIGIAIWLVPSAICLGVCWLLGLLRPGGLDRPGPRRVEGLSAWGWFAVGLGLWVLQQAGAVIAGVVAGIVVASGDGGATGGAGSKAGESAELLMLGLGTAGTFVIAIPLAIVAMRLVSSWAPGAGLRARWIDLPLGVAGLLLIGPLVLLVNTLIVWVVSLFDGPPEQITHDLLRMLAEGEGGLGRWGIVFGAVVGAPIVEEVIFRGFLQSAIRRLVGSAWPAIFIASAVFALVHWWSLAGGRHALVVIFALSLGLGAAFERTKSLGVPIVIHMLFNASQISLVLLMGQGEAAP